MAAKNRKHLYRSCNGICRRRHTNRYCHIAQLLCLYLFRLLITMRATALFLLTTRSKASAKPLTWDAAYLTVHCHKTFRRAHSICLVVFHDHYLSEKEVFSWRVRKQGLCIRLNYESTQFILSKCKNKIETLNDNFFFIIPI